MTHVPYIRSEDTRQIARGLLQHPVPVLSNCDVQRRWHCSRSTVDRYRKRFGLVSVSDEGHPAFSLTDLLCCEGVADALTAWVFGTDEDRRLFAAPLLSIEELELLDERFVALHPETYRSRARRGRGRPGIKIGHRWLFRPRIRDLGRLEAARTGDAERK